MWWKELSLSDANEYLLKVFQSLLECKDFRSFVDSNYVIRQYFDPEDGELVTVEIINKEEPNGERLPKKHGKTLH